MNVRVDRNLQHRGRHPCGPQPQVDAIVGTNHPAQVQEEALAPARLVGVGQHVSWPAPSLGIDAVEPARLAHLGDPPSQRLAQQSGDVAVAGVSLVTNYRDEFNAQIQAGGIDGLLKTLAAKNKGVAAK